jgi:hypothetical protein
MIARPNRQPVPGAGTTVRPVLPTLAGASPRRASAACHAVSSAGDTCVRTSQIRTHDCCRAATRACATARDSAAVTPAASRLNATTMRGWPGKYASYSWSTLASGRVDGRPDGH